VLAARLVTMPGAIRRLTAMCLPRMASAAAWFPVLLVDLRHPNPTVPYGGGSGAASLVTAGISGLFFDQQFGVAAERAGLSCVALGFLRHAPAPASSLALELLIIALPYFLLVAAFPMWWGGYSAPSRFLVSLILTGGAPARSGSRPEDGRRADHRHRAARVERAASPSRSRRSIAARCCSTRATVLAAATADVAGRRSDTRPAERIPGRRRRSPLPCAVWLLAIACPPAIAVLLDRRGMGPRRARAGRRLRLDVTAMAATPSSGAAIIRSPSRARPEDSKVLRRYDADRRQLALSYQPFRRMAMTELPPRMVLAHTNANARRPEDPILYLTQPVPACTRWKASRPRRVRPHPRAPRSPVAWHRGLGRLVGDRSWRRTVRLPAAADLLRFDADPEARRSVLRLSIRRSSFQGQPTATAGRPGDPRDKIRPAVLFQTDGAAYMEPSGTGCAPEPLPTSSPFPTLARVSASLSAMGVRPTASRSWVRRWNEQLTLSAGEERLLDAPSDAGRFVAVRVTSRLARARQTSIRTAPIAACSAAGSKRARSLFDLCGAGLQPCVVAALKGCATTAMSKPL
jgi:hypothetical protein